MEEYGKFILNKTHSAKPKGLPLKSKPREMFGFQAALTEWALDTGRAALFADCGMGKTIMQLTWAQNVIEATGKPVLLLTPLAVGQQTLEEARRFGVDADRSKGGECSRPLVHIANYERLHHFRPEDFSGVVCDESSILKNEEGATRQAVVDFMRHTPYRLLCTATAAPNDYIELGNSSEALGYLGYFDMLTRFFKSDTDSIRPFVFGLGGKHNAGSRWRFKGHAGDPFWRWVCSWARSVRKPSDIGFPDDGFALPPIVRREHIVSVATRPEGQLFASPAVGLAEQRKERARSLSERVEKVIELTDHGRPAIAWCHLNRESELLASGIDGAEQVSGSDSDDEKEAKFLRFITGETRVLVTKPSIGAMGLNFQHCAHMTFFPSHSFEQMYQAERRCWRYGQKSEVTVDIVVSEGEKGVLDNVQRKAEQASVMFAELVAKMGEGSAVSGAKVFGKELEVPKWL